MEAGVAEQLDVAAALDLLGAYRRMRARLDADEAVLLARLAADPNPYRDGHGELGKQWIREDVACALQVAPVTAGAKLDIAGQLVARFPSTLTAMRDGVVPGYYATRLVEAATGVGDRVAAKIEAKVLERAATQTSGQFGASLRRAVATFDTRATEEKLTSAREERRVVVTPREDGMSELWALLPAEQAAKLKAQLDQLAHSWKGLDERTADQRRADALCSLGGDSVKTCVSVTVPVSMLLDQNDQPGELDGHGPIPATIARELAFDPNSRWRRLLVDDNGHLVDVSCNTYRPPAPLERFVELRDVTCQFPTCRRKATHSEIHHLKAWLQGGPTAAANLICLCSRHHHLRHDGGWQLTRDPDGTAVWTSPTGHNYHRPPPEPPPH